MSAQSHRGWCSLLHLCAFAFAAASMRSDAAPNSPERVAAYAKLPDWSGLWQTDMAAAFGPPGATPPAAGGSGSAPPAGLLQLPKKVPYNEAWQARIDAYRAKLEAMSGEEQVPDNTVTECVWGIPRVFDGPYNFEVTVLPDQVFFDYDILEFRHIWTDGRKHPATAASTLTHAGHSIGHWEGETLIVDTVGVRPLWIDGMGSTLSNRAHFTERWTHTPPDRLQLELTIDDPVALKEPYRVKYAYKRIKDTNRMLQQDCYENIHEVRRGDKVITEFAPSEKR